MEDRGNDSDANNGKLTTLVWHLTQSKHPTLFFKSKRLTLPARAPSASEKGC